MTCQYRYQPTKEWSQSQESPTPLTKQRMMLRLKMYLTYEPALCLLHFRQNLLTHRHSSSLTPKFKHTGRDRNWTSPTMSLRQHHPQSPAPAYRSASRQTDRSVHSNTNTYVPSGSQAGYDNKTDDWRKQQPDWRGHHQERFAPPPPPQQQPPPQAYGSGHGGYGTPSGGYAYGYPDGGFDPKYDSINDAPPTRDTRRKKGVYGTMCCGSGWGIAAWVVGSVVVIAVLVVVLLKLFVSLDLLYFA